MLPNSKTNFSDYFLHLVSKKTVTNKVKNRLTDWERRFLRSVFLQLRDYGYPLTSKQELHLKIILREQFLPELEGTIKELNEVETRLREPIQLSLLPTA